MGRYSVIKASEKHALTAAANASRSIPILWLQVTSIDKRIDFPRIHLDHHQLIFGACERDESAPLEFSGRASVV